MTQTTRTPEETQDVEKWFLAQFKFDYLHDISEFTRIECISAFSRRVTAVSSEGRMTIELPIMEFLKGAYDQLPKEDGKASLELVHMCGNLKLVDEHDKGAEWLKGFLTSITIRG